MQAKRLLTAAALVLAALLILDVPGAYAHSVDDYRSAVSGDWHTPGTWERWDGDSWEPPTLGQGAPDESNFVTIQAVHVIDVAAEGGDQSVDHMDVYGTLDIEVDRTLTIDGSNNGTTNVDGTINLEGASSRLLFTKGGANDHTLSYDSNQGMIAGASNTAKIELDTVTDPTLTSIIIIEGALQIRAEDSTFVNNGLVHANCAGTLDILSGTIDDSSGDRWQVSDSNAVLKFSVSPTRLNGNFMVSNGRLEIGAPVTTKGDLTVGGSGRVDVHKDFTVWDLDLADGSVIHLSAAGECLEWKGEFLGCGTEPDNPLCGVQTYVHECPP